MTKIFARYKEHLTKTLLVFVIFSIGFAFGKHSVKTGNSTSKPSDTLAQTNLATADSQVKLYYMHAMFRCVTCNSIEERAKNLTKNKFADEMASRKIVWEDVNFQQNQTLAGKFDVVSSCVVVAVVKNGQIDSFERLDQVWTLIEKPDEFDNYINAAIKKALSRI